MSHLKLYTPLAEPLPDTSVREAGIGRSAKTGRDTEKRLPDPSAWQDVATRARLIHTNRTCHHCRRTTVVPLEMQDAFLNRNLMPIPGTATLVGFHCCSCGSEWDAAD